MKNILRIVFCFVLIFTVMLSMASCDIKGTFSSLGKGDFKGAWNAMIGKETEKPVVHEHAYTAVVTVPDCVNAGYTTYTCECGDSYVGDNVPALGHDYNEKVTRFPTPRTQGIISKICSVCGVHTDTYLNTITFTLPEISDSLKSLVGTNSFAVSAKNSEIVLVKEIETEKDISYNKEFLAIKLGYVEINGEGEELYAYFTCDLGVASYRGPDADAAPEFDSQTTITVIVEGENVSVAITEDGESGEEDYKLSKLFYSAMASSFGMTYEQFEELAYVSGKISECMPFVENIIGTIVTLGSDEVEPMLPILLSLIGENVIVEEDKKYSFNLAGLVNIISPIQDKKIGELVDERYGVGTFDRVENFLVSLPTMTVRDVVDLAVEISNRSGVSLDELYALVNYYVYSMTGEDFNIESEIVLHYNMTIVGILLESSGYTDEEISEQITEMTTNIQEAFSTIRDINIDQFYNLIMFGDADYCINGEPFRIIDQLSDMIMAYDEMIIMAEIALDENGSVELITLNIRDVVYLQAGYVDESEQFNLYIYDGDDYNAFLVKVSEEDALIRYFRNDLCLFSLGFIKNNLGEITSAGLEINQLITISGQMPDPENPDGYIWDEHEELEQLLFVEYENNDGEIEMVVQTPDTRYTISATSTETSTGLTITGEIWDYGSDMHPEAEGSFKYVENNDGSGCEFELDIDAIAYDYTETYEGEECIRVYDYENPKKYDLLNVNFTCDAEGNMVLVLDLNDVVFDEGVSEVQDYRDIAITITHEEDDIVIDVDYDEWCVKVTLSTVGAKLEVYQDEELNILAEIEVIETENGVNLKLNIEGLEYTHYEYEYVDNSIEYDGSPVTIVFYHTMGYNLQSVLDEYIAEFNQMYPNIYVIHEQVGSYDDVRDATQFGLAYGNQPNIVYCYADHVALYNMTGKVVALDDFINDSSMGLTEEELANFIDGFYEEGATFDEEGTMYMLPMSKSTEVLYYNKTFFDQYGIQVPTTWEEVEAVCEMIKEIEPYSIPFGYDSSANWFITMCAQYGSDYTSLGDDNFLFDNETNREFVKMFRDWFDKGYLVTQDIYGGYISSLFTEGKCYMYVGSSAGARHNTTSAFTLGVAPIPQVDPMNPKSIMQGPSLCILDQDNKQEVAASWLFMKFLTTNPEFQADFSMVSGYMPVIEYDIIVDEVPVYEYWLEYSGGIVAEALMVAFEQEDAFFVSPAFMGSSVARDQVGQLINYCLVTPATNIEAMIEAAFKKAIQECIYQS